MPLCGSGQHIPKFSEVLSLVRGRVPMIVEYKTEDTDMSLCPPIDAMLTAYQKEYAAEYCIESFNPLVLGWYRRHHSSVMRGQLSDGFLYDPKMRGVFYKTIFLFTLQFLLWNCYTAPDFIAYNVKYRRNPSRCLCHGLFRNLAAAWTVRSEKELEEARSEPQEVAVEDTSRIEELQKQLEQAQAELAAANARLAERPMVQEALPVTDGRDAFKAYLSAAADSMKRLYAFIEQRRSDADFGFFIEKTKGVVSLAQSELTRLKGE